MVELALLHMRSKILGYLVGFAAASQTFLEAYGLKLSPPPCEESPLACRHMAVLSNQETRTRSTVIPIVINKTHVAGSGTAVEADRLPPE